MQHTKSLSSLRVPLGGQEIELQEIGFEVGGMAFLRLRIREGKRFTIFDLDPVSAAELARVMGQWAEAQPAEGREADGA